MYRDDHTRNRCDTYCDVRARKRADAPSPRAPLTPFWCMGRPWDAHGTLPGGGEEVMSSSSSLGIRGRLIFGFSVLCLLIAAMDGFTIMRVESVRGTTEQAVALQAPTAIAGTDLIGKVYGSIAALRGWMLTGKATFKAERASRWQEIDSRAAELDALAPHWADRDRQD